MPACKITIFSNVIAELTSDLIIMRNNNSSKNQEIKNLAEMITIETRRFLSDASTSEIEKFYSDKNNISNLETAQKILKEVE